MPEIKVLSLRDMLSRQKGSFTRRFIHAVIGISLRLFFRRIETSGEELVPMVGPVIFVLNHPNGLIDPALVFCALPRRVSFLAKSTLFGLPVLGRLMRTVDALPVYRHIDKGADVRQNKKTFEACHELLQRGRCIALFPEGVSHNSTFLLPVKTGAARIALGALSIGKDAVEAIEELGLKIVPVGLYYTSKTSFRSEALLRFGNYLEVEPVELDQEGEPPREHVRLLSARIEAALREVTLNVEDDAALEEVKKAEQLFSSLYESINIKQSLSEEFDLRRRFAEERQFYRAQSPEIIKRLRERLYKYDEALAGLGITTGSLSVFSHTRLFVLRHFVLNSILLIIVSPLAIAGAIVHYPAYLICDLLSGRYKKHGVDDIVSTVKILAAIVLMPLTWLIVAALVYIYRGWPTAAMTLPLVVLCGYVAMRFFEVIQDMKGWYKAVLVLLGQRRLFIQLLRERRALYNELKRLARNAGS
ncbi:MAG: glycerol-3-phosphate O-acyltransferase / dihydroxyacetone phosphate acyltransferase [Blastocatellia bacterium]|jgi:1-acyl-sn-glycerol-3-phosphate acyltransferase|nr:glycerol-3-phosphate O-acyltransferase / dihydroxyacetone phosphate acyltransferase [Blastocatellia bacterium]